MSHLRDYTDAALEAELERRRSAKKQVPVALTAPDFGPLKKMCEQHLEQIAADGRDDDMITYIYEAAIEAVFGKSVWEWLNNKS